MCEINGYDLLSTLKWFPLTSIFKQSLKKVFLNMLLTNLNTSFFKDKLIHVDQLYIVLGNILFAIFG